MSRHVYLDTNAFRYFGTAFRDVPLAVDLRDKILISPLSAFEVFAQLANEKSGDEVLSQIQAVQNWINPMHCSLLPWPDGMLYQLWFQKPVQDDEFTKKMTLSFNVCLAAASVEEIKEEALNHKQVMGEFKLRIAQDFKNFLDGAKSEHQKTFDMARAWYLGVAKRVHAAPDSKSVSEIVATLSAYCEFEKSKLQIALTDPKYNPLSKTNQNDIIDSEQLVYLGDTSLYMLTSDKKIESKVKKSNQAHRVITAPPEDLKDAQIAQAVLRCILSS